MQDMTDHKCYIAEIGETKQLIDSRDNKYYWVTKLKDGNCWMTQNLDFDIPATLYSTTSDISSASVTTGTTKATAPSNWPASNDNPNYNGYYDPGDYIYNGPSNPAHGQGTACSANSSSADALSVCNQFAKSTITNTSTQVLGDTNRHYHVGNYYSFSAATVKSGDSLTNYGDQAPDSICPKGWELPTSGINGQFAELLTKYGVNIYLTNGSYAIYKEPLYFVYGGDLYSSALNLAGNYGYYWSSTVYSDANAFFLIFISSVNAAADNHRYLGFPVRCVAE